MAKRGSDFVIPSSLDIRHSTFSDGPIANDAQLCTLLPKLAPHERIAVDTEADSLHCYREKLCLLQISISGDDGKGDNDFIVDPLANVDLAPLRDLLEQKEIVLHGADYDLRLLRRSLNFSAKAVFDTVIGARLLGIREFSLAALVKRYFDVDLVKGSQKANWAQRPLPDRMLQYAVNDTHYLLPLADKLKAELKQADRLTWFQQSCQRAVEQAAVDRTRDAEEAWRISGSGALPPRTSAILRELWRWRESEAEAVDRPPFHVLQNRDLLKAAEKFAAGGKADFRHFSGRRRAAFLAAAQRGLDLPEADWPKRPRRSGTRPTAEMVRRADELKAQRDRAAAKLKLEPNLVAPRTALEAIAADESRAATILTPWQRGLLGFDANAD